MKRTTELVPLMNFFAETLRETLVEWDVSQAEVSRMTGIPSPHLTDMKKSGRRSTLEKRRRLVAVLDRSERDALSGSERAGGVPSQYDLRLCRNLWTSPGFWLRLQFDFELMRAERKKGERIRREVQPHSALNEAKMLKCVT